jgi:hypothetical protein
MKQRSQHFTYKKSVQKVVAYAKAQTLVKNHPLTMHCNNYEPLSATSNFTI